MLQSLNNMVSKNKDILLLKNFYFKYKPTFIEQLILVNEQTHIQCSTPKLFSRTQCLVSLETPTSIYHYLNLPISYDRTISQYNWTLYYSSPKKKVPVAVISTEATPIVLIDYRLRKYTEMIRLKILQGLNQGV